MNHQLPVEQLHYSSRREIDELYIAITIKNFAIGLVGIFVPIYVYLLFEKSIPLVFLFYAVTILGQVLLTPLTAKLFSKIGIKKMMAGSAPFLGFYLLFLVLAKEQALFYIIFAGIAKIIYLPGYWPAYHVDFTKFSNPNKRGRQVGFIHILVALVKTIAPLIGGFFIVKFGFMPLFIVAAILIALSSIPLFFSPEVYSDHIYSWKKSFSNAFAKKNRAHFTSFFTMGIECFVGGFLFPIFVFIMIDKLDTIGWVTSVSLFATLLFTYFMGWLSDKKSEEKIMVKSIPLHVLSWLSNALIVTPMQYFGFSTFRRLAETATHLPFLSLFYGRAENKKENLANYVILRELACNIGRVLIALIIAGGFFIGITSWWVYFGIAAAMPLFFKLYK